jgi:hypothetical protein
MFSLENNKYQYRGMAVWTFKHKAAEDEELLSSLMLHFVRTSHATLSHSDNFKREVIGGTTVLDAIA